MSTNDYWEIYQKTQSVKDMLTWLKHRAWLRIEAERTGEVLMRLVQITVYNYKNEFHLPGKLVVNAFCVGGDEGVFAVFRIPSDHNLIGFAYGDDGHWQIAKVYHQHWLEGIVEALNALMK
jgi:hypothetical protein